MCLIKAILKEDFVALPTPLELYIIALALFHTQFTICMVTIGVKIYLHPFNVSTYIG